MSRFKRNEVVLIGNLGRNPEQRGKIVVLSVAVQSYRKNPAAKPTDRSEYITNWFRVVCFQKLHDEALAYSVGDRVRVTGSVETTSWEKDGVKHYGFEVHATSISMDGDREAQREARGEREEPDESPQRTRAHKPKKQPVDASFFDDTSSDDALDDDDVPF